MSSTSFCLGFALVEITNNRIWGWYFFFSAFFFLSLTLSLLFSSWVIYFYPMRHERMIGKISQSERKAWKTLKKIRKIIFWIFPTYFFRWFWDGKCKFISKYLQTNLLIISWRKFSCFRTLNSLTVYSCLLFNDFSHYLCLHCDWLKSNLCCCLLRLFWIYLL